MKSTSPRAVRWTRKRRGRRACYARGKPWDSLQGSMASIASAIGLQCRRQRTVAIALLLCAFGAACSGSHVQPGRDGAFVVLLPRDALEVDPRFTVDAYGLKLSRLLFASLVTIDSVSLAI